jgi:hypothetical protein
VIKKLRQRSGLIGDISAFLVILALVGGLIWLWWAASIGIRPANRRGNSVVMSANAEGTRQVTLIDRSLGFQGCKVGSKFKLRRISSSTGFTNYKFVPGSCTKP